jgi:drug/metabolite transporter (DMT)-like permease
MTNENNAEREHQLAGQGAVFLCALLWSTSGLFIKLIDWHPMVIAGGRSILAAALLLALRAFSQRRKHGTGNYAASDKIKFDKETVVKMLTLAALGLCYAFTMILFVIANKLTASANAIVLQYMAPVWAALLGWLVLRERLNWEHWCAFVLVGAGMFFVFSSGFAKGSLLGDMLAFVSGIAFGANSVVLRLKKDSNPADILIFSHIICALFSIPFFILHPPVINAPNMMSILFMGIFQIGTASALFAYGIKRITAAQAMLTASIEPVMNPVWVFVVIGEKPSISVIIGGCLIMAAVVFPAVMRYAPRLWLFREK